MAAVRQINIFSMLKNAQTHLLQELPNQLVLRYGHSTYFETKVLAAVSAIVYQNTDSSAEIRRAEELADATHQTDRDAAHQMYEHLDKRSGKIKGRRWDQQRDLPGLIKMETEDGRQPPELFWMEHSRRSRSRCLCGNRYV